MNGSLLYLVAVFLATSAIASPCYYSSPTTGCHYDFSSLVLSEAPYYTFPASFTYEVNICEPIASTCADAESGVCQHSPTMTRSLGKASRDFTDLPSSMSQGQCQGARLVYSVGLWCSDDDLSGQTTIDILCDPHAQTPYISDAKERKGKACAYHITMHASQACGTTLPSDKISSACMAIPVHGIRPGSDVTLFGSIDSTRDRDEGHSPMAWYTLETDGYETIVISTCNSYTNFNTELQLHEGPCTVMHPITGSDHNSCSSLGSTITFTSVPHVQYLVSVSGESGDAGDFQLSMYTFNSTGSSCAKAISLTPPYFKPLTVNGTNQHTPITLQSSCGMHPGDHAVWYRINAQIGLPVMISTCSVGTDFETVLSLYGGSCDDLQCVAFNGNCSNGLKGMASKFSFTPTQPYYWLVVTGRNGTVGNYSLVIQQEGTGGYNCALPMQLTLNHDIETFHDTTTTSGNLTTSLCGLDVGKAYWYYVHVTKASQITITTCGANFDTVLSVYFGSCSQLECVASNNDSPCAITSTTSQVTVNEYQPFYVIVSGFQGAVGDFHLTFFTE